MGSSNGMVGRSWDWLRFCSMNGGIHANMNGLFGCIVPGGKTVNGKADYCFAHGEPLTGAGVEPTCANGKSGCVGFRRGDFRLYDSSPAQGLVTYPEEEWGHVPLDMDGNAIGAVSLAGNTAGAHQRPVDGLTPPGAVLLVR